MITVTICEDIIAPETWRVCETDDLCAYLARQWSIFPDSGRIYHNYVADSNDVTPHNEAEIERLQSLHGDFYIVIWPEGPVTIGIIVAIAIGAVAIGLAFLLRPNTRPANQQQSPNNALADRQNRARPNERIPDIVGTVRSTPDLLSVPYKTFINNKEIETSYMCISRGDVTILDCKDGDTPVDYIDGEFVAIYAPFTSPNNGAVKQTFGTNSLSVIPPVYSVRQSNSVNGQVLRAPNSGSINVSNNVAFQYPDTVLTNGSRGLDFTDYFVASNFATNQIQYMTIYTNDSGVNASDPGGHIHSVGLAGTYIVLSVTSTSVVLSNPAAINPNWNILATFTGQVSTYYHSFIIDGDSSTWVGPFILQVADMNQVWCNFVEPNGLYYINSDGNQHPLSVTIQLGVQAVDANNQPIGDEVFGSINLTGSQRQQIQVGATLQMTLPSAGYVQVRAQRITPKGTSTKNTYVEQIQWRDLFAVSSVAAQDFGNVTTLVAITAPTQDALSIKQRKLNLLVTRNLPTWVNRSVAPPQFSTALSPTNNAADIICAMALDPFIGRRIVAELDIEGIYEVADSLRLGGEHIDGEIASYFNTRLSTEFCYTFDDSKVSFEESLGDIAQAINCVAYRSGSVISLSFEKKTDASVMLFNHRNKLPSSETRTVTFGSLNDNDGVDYDFIDPNAPNYPNADTTVTLYFPPDRTAQNPKKVTSVGVRNSTQAMLNGWRLYQKLRYQNTQVEFEATQEAALLIIQDRILVADNTRADMQDGEIVDQSSLLITLSQNVAIVGNSATLFIQHYDETVEAITVTQPSNIQANQLILANAPALPLVYDLAMFARTTYILSNADSKRSNVFLVAEKEPLANLTYKVKAVNYDDNYYAHDKDVLTGVLIDPPCGYGPQGYTGAGSLNAVGSACSAVGPRPGFSADAYTRGGLSGQNNPDPLIATSLGGQYSGDTTT